MISLFKRLSQLVQMPKSEESSYTTFWKSAFYGLLSFSLVIMTLSGVFFRTGLPLWLMALAALLIGGTSFWLLRILGVLIHQGITKIPSFIFAVFIGALGTLLIAKGIRFDFPESLFYTLLVLFITGITFLFGSGAVLLKGISKTRTFHIASFFVSLLFLGLIIYFLTNEGTDFNKISFQQTAAPLLSTKGISNPGNQGSHQTVYFTYGSGTDKQRTEFRSEIKYKSNTVDASRLLPEWKGSKARWRERYWGFSVNDFPLNGRVWMPEGKGKFPLVLIVHGNHGMEDYSDPGYAYLGELLASRGFIAVSIDENFINATWSGDFRGKEMPVRGWLLLKHLELWKVWTSDSAHDLFNKADLDNVLLIGHSRGGEAAPIAARFNKLKYFPDDSNEKFDFGYGIRGIVAIAPTDKRYDRRIKLENINYLSLQGSYDSDEASFFGLRQYQRITFDDSTFHFKSGLYIHGANHGQFNSTWGKYDGGPPGRWLLNTAPMMTIQEQQQIAKVYISAFAETVLHGKKEYIGLFKNSAVASDWLPDKILINNYKDSNTKSLVSFEEDIDLTTGSISGSQIKGIDLRIWKESQLRFRDDDTQGKNAVTLGWKTDSTKIPAYQITFGNAIAIEPNTSLLLSIGRGDESELRNKNNSKDEKKPGAPDDELNFQIQLTDSLGAEVSLDINEVKKITPRLKIQYLKLKDLGKEGFGEMWEPTVETFEIPIQRFKGSNKFLDSIKNINFNFNRTQKGVLILDEVALIRNEEN